MRSRRARRRVAVAASRRHGRRVSRFNWNALNTWCTVGGKGHQRVCDAAFIIVFVDDP